MPTRESVIEAAEKYLVHGLVEHDGNKVPLAENVVRREQGRNTGQGRPGLIQALSHEVMNVITGIRNVRWIVEDEQAVAFYDLDTKGSDRPVLIAERVRVDVARAVHVDHAAPRVRHFHGPVPVDVHAAAAGGPRNSQCGAQRAGPPPLPLPLPLIPLMPTSP